LTPLAFLLGLCLPVVTLGYIIWCSASPWGTCTRCRRTSRTCSRCDGTGMRPRLGWQLWTYLRSVYRDGTR
jgi:hypothetical protein